MGMSVGICGIGSFAQNFIPLFKRHPLVDRVVLCDLDPAKLAAACDKFGLENTCPSLEKLVETDVDAVALFTQHDRHAPQAVQALRAGKHVYSAVPSAISMDELRDLVAAVSDTKRIYQIGETSYYYPQAIYCRKRFRAGDFGYIVYGEGEYIHDWSHGLEHVYKTRFGADWQKHVTIPPFYYPTHSTSLIVSVTGAHVRRVSGMGVKHQYKPGETDFTKVPGRLYANDFENEVMLCQMSDGSVSRIGEFRRLGYAGRQCGVGMSLYGSEASYEEQTGTDLWTAVWTGKTRDSIVDLTDTLRCGHAHASATDRAAMKAGGMGEEIFRDVASVHPVELLPDNYRGLGNGHLGSHQFLVHEFVTACDRRTPGPNNVWQAARYLAPGLIAHESAMQGGVLMDVPDFGDAPEIFELC
jgi:predicted dehydrogenase